MIFVFKMLGVSLSFEWHSESYIAKIVSKRTGTLICSTKFLSSEAALYLFKSAIWPSMMEFCGHVWVSTPSCCLDMFNEL